VNWRGEFTTFTTSRPALRGQFTTAASDLPARSFPAKFILSDAVRARRDKTVSEARKRRDDNVLRKVGT